MLRVLICQIVMVLDTVLVGVTAEFLVDSINGLVASNPSLSAEWVGLILLPIVSRLLGTSLKTTFADP